MICSELVINDIRFGTRTKASVWADAPMSEWDGSRPAVVLPMYGEFGWLIMTHVRFVHSLAALRKTVCCGREEVCLYPSATDCFFDWQNPIDDGDRCGHGGYRHNGRCRQYDSELLDRLGAKHPGAALIRPIGYDCVWHLSDAVKYRPAARQSVPPVDIALGVRKRDFVEEKNWRHWGELIRVLQSLGFTVGLIGGKATSFADLPADARAWDHPDGDTAGSVDILSNCRLYVGTDSGTSHLAALMDIPMVVFRRCCPGNSDLRDIMGRSNKNLFYKLDDGAWDRPDEVIGAVIRRLTTVRRLS